MKKTVKQTKRMVPLKKTSKLVRKVKLKVTRKVVGPNRQSHSVVLDPQAEYRRKRPFTFIDLFCGIGGFHIAFHEQGGECVFASDWDKYSQKTYGANFPGTRLEGDITKVDFEEDIPKGFDVLCAGFPCQPFSLAGVSKKNSLGRKHGFDDERQGNLFFHIADILAVHEPPAFVLENVKNLKSHDKGNTFRRIMRILKEDLGYHVVDPRIIDAKAYVPQHRERIFIVGFKDEQAMNSFQWPEMSEAPFPKLNKVLSTGPVDDRYTLTDHLWRYLQNYKAKHEAAGNGFGFSLVGPNDIARTLSARYHKDGSEILIDQGPLKNPRRLTPDECRKLMGFPKGFKIEGIVSDTQAYRQFGNSVVVPVVSAIAASVMQALREPVEKRPVLQMEFREPKVADLGTEVRIRAKAARVTDITV